jgi:phenylacetate-CoA ligase
VPDGEEGELVLTTFGEALPLIRYRFGDLIEVVTTEPCKCGITHPRIKVPRRADLSTIALGAIRFPVAKLEEKVLSATSFGQANRWQLQICREGYRPKLVIRVESDGAISDPQSFTKEIIGKVLELEVIKTGCENKLLAEPEVRIEPVLSQSKQVSKCGSVIFEGE